MTSPELTFDETTNAIYIRFSDEDVAETIELSKTTYVDVDANGSPVGFEILAAAPYLMERLKSVRTGTSLAEFVKLLAA